MKAQSALAQTVSGQLPMSVAAEQTAASMQGICPPKSLSPVESPVAPAPKGLHVVSAPKPQTPTGLVAPKGAGIKLLQLSDAVEKLKAAHIPENLDDIRDEIEDYARHVGRETNLDQVHATGKLYAARLQKLFADGGVAALEDVLRDSEAELKSLSKEKTEKVGRLVRGLTKSGFGQTLLKAALGNVKFQEQADLVGTYRQTRDDLADMAHLYARAQEGIEALKNAQTDKSGVVVIVVPSVLAGVCVLCCIGCCIGSCCC